MSDPVSDNGARAPHDAASKNPDASSSLPTVLAGTDDLRVEARGSFSEKDVQGYIPTPDSEQLRVSVDPFEGPLDLLLFLIEKHALDVFDIPIKVVVAEYLKVLDEMRELNLDVAGEFLVMAAQLAHIKSRMLLPREHRPKESGNVEQDPRAELVRRLLEYQRYKDAAQRLDALPQLGRDVYTRPPLPPQFDGPVEEPREQGLHLAEVEVLDLIRLFDAILKRQQKFVVHEVLVERISVGARINEMVDIFVGARDVGVFTFADLVDRFGPRTRRGVIVTFLSVLEMARLRLIRLRQDAETGLIDVLPMHDNLRAEPEQDESLVAALATVDEFEGEASDTEEGAS